MTKREEMIGIEIFVDLTDEEIREIKEIAEAEGMSFNQAVAMLLDIGITEFRRAPIRKLIESLIREGLRTTKEEREMPKQGMTGLTLKIEVAELLRSKAKASGIGVNDYLTAILMGPSSGQSWDRPTNMSNALNLLESQPESNLKLSPVLKTETKGVSRTVGFGLVARDRFTITFTYTE